METVLLGIAVIACPLGMAAMVLFMWNGMRSNRSDEAAPSLDDLRIEHDKLGGEIERLERTQGADRLTPAQR